jgi:lipopolysaccharide export system protein LptC
MSKIAEIERSKRRIWARPGSSHDYVIKVLRVALPASVGVLAAFMIMAPLTNTKGDISFVLAKDSVDMAKERLRVVEAVYRGEDSKGRAFSLRAGSAIQKTSREPIIVINDVTAELSMAEGPATIAAKTAAFNMDTDTISVVGLVNFQTSDGYKLDMKNVSINLKTREVKSTGGVAGAAPEGQFSGGQIAANVRDRTISMGGGVSGNTPMGSFNGSRMAANLNTRRVIVDGNANGTTRAGTYRANRLTIDQQARTVELDGNAQLSGNVSISANRIIITDTGASNRAEASGGVTVRRGDQVGRSAYASYDPTRRTVVLSGGVVLTQGSNVMRGGRLTLNLDTKSAVVDGSGGMSGSSEGNRVSGTFGVSGQ